MKVFKYIKNAIASSGFIFLQETHFTIHMKKKSGTIEFKGKLFFLHGQSNSCGVAIGFIGNMNSKVSNKKQDF